MSVTYQKKTKKRKRTHGFRKRMRTKGGEKILSKRRRKKREQLTV